MVIMFGYLHADSSKDIAVVSPSTNIQVTDLPTAMFAAMARTGIPAQQVMWVEADPDPDPTLLASAAAQYGLMVGRPDDWDPVANYVLDVAASTLTLPDLETVDITKLYFVTDLTAGATLQWSGASGNVITLTGLPSAVQDDDTLSIDYRPASG